MYFDLTFQDIKKINNIEVLLTLLHVSTEIYQRHFRERERKKVLPLFFRVERCLCVLLGVHIRREAN